MALSRVQQQTKPGVVCLCLRWVMQCAVALARQRRGWLRRRSKELSCRCVYVQHVVCVTRAISARLHLRYRTSNVASVLLWWWCLGKVITVSGVSGLASGSIRRDERLGKRRGITQNQEGLVSHPSWPHFTLHTRIGEEKNELEMKSSHRIWWES